jgi:alpha-amylase/alpha-mannosidase (GH57 family)
MSESGNRFLVVHGHFYQPPRENPWIESVETQDSAAPYHDWNDRITAECYARNGASRIVNTENEILRIVNNYARMSFNFGPTLLSWLEEHAELTYRSILEADRLSAERFGGHGSAMAQVYNHVIMPLASRRDKELQVRWGIADFEHRFGRRPEGMWLAETAVDTETLEVLAGRGIKFTVLAPSQCAAVREIPPPVFPQGNDLTEGAELAAGAELPPGWVATPDASANSRHPYLIKLKNGGSIAVFFYDGPRSRAIAFEHLLNSGEGFALRMAEGFSGASPDEPELVHVATDGESYGHHHRFGEMALSYALQYTEERGLATVTNYGEFLERFPPKREAKIAEATSWSCAHGVERWRSDCGCNGGRAGWNQRWRGPLRAALDGVRDSIGSLAAGLGERLFKDWEGACNRFIGVMLDRSQAGEFLRREQARSLTEAERVQALQLLEMERHAQLMYTSCGWFFDDISGIETVQIIAYAARVLELAAVLFGEQGAALEPVFVARLAEAQSNVGSEGSGAEIYRRHAKALEVGLEQVAAHYAISSVFKTYPEHAPVFAFEVRRCGEEVQNSGRGRLVSGEADICSTLTHERERLVYAVLHFGDQNIAAGVKRAGKDDCDAHVRFTAEVREAMMRADLPAVIRLFDREFEGMTYTIRSLFTDEQRRVMKLILSNTVEEAEESLIRLYDDHASLLHFLSEAEVPRPSALALAANFAVNVTLRRALESDPIDAAQMRAALALAEQDHVDLDRAELSFTADGRMRDAMAAFAAQPEDRGALERALAVAEAVRLLPFPANIWQAQNIWCEIASGQQKDALSRRVADRERFGALGRALGISVDAVELELREALG